MNQLVTVLNEQPVTSSLQIAENFDREHKDVLKIIYKVQKDVKKAREDSDSKKAKNCAFYNDMFLPDKYEVNNNPKKYPMFYINKDGFVLLVMGFTGSKATQFKLRYIEEFNRMEQELKNKNTLSLPQDYASALRKLADTVEENEQLKLELAKTKVPVISEQLELDILYTTEEIAEMVGYSSARKLNQRLEELRIVYFQKGLWCLYATHKDRGYKDMSTRRKSQLWTSKGVEFIKKSLVGKDKFSQAKHLVN